MDRDQFLRIGLIIEVACLALAFVINVVWPIPVELNPLHTVTGLTTLGAFAIGILAAVALATFFWITWNVPFTPFKKIRDFVNTQLASHLSECQPWEVMLIAASAGIGEEVLFRGALQPRLGLLVASLLFGLLHAVTPTYVIIATLLGAFMGWLQNWSGNLWTPIVCHAVYDYIAFLFVIHDFRRQQLAKV